MRRVPGLPNERPLFYGEFVEPFGRLYIDNMKVILPTVMICALQNKQI
jgi:hypothetical protein